MMGYPGYGYGDGGSLIGMAAMMLFGLVFLAGLIALVVWAISAAASPRHTMYPSGTTSACDIAKQRYARGEITKEQFEEICRAVGG